MQHSKKIRNYLVALAVTATCLSGFLPLITLAETPGATNPADPGATNPANPGATNPADPGATNPSTSGTLVNPLKVGTIDQLLAIILDAVIKLGATILVLALIWIGFLFVAARGNPEKIASARTALFWTIIGGLILLGAKGISAVVQSTASTL